MRHDFADPPGMKPLRLGAKAARMSAIAIGGAFLKLHLALRTKPACRRLGFVFPQWPVSPGGSGQGRTRGVPESQFE